MVNIGVGEPISTAFYYLTENAPPIDVLPTSSEVYEITLDTDHDLIVTTTSIRAYVQTAPIKLDGQLSLLCSWRPIPTDETMMTWTLFIHHDRINDLPSSVNRHNHFYNADRTLLLSIDSDDRPFPL